MNIRYVTQIRRAFSEHLSKNFVETLDGPVRMEQIFEIVLVLAFSVFQSQISQVRRPRRPLTLLEICK